MPGIIIKELEFVGEVHLQIKDWYPHSINTILVYYPRKKRLYLRHPTNKRMIWRLRLKPNKMEAFQKGEEIEIRIGQRHENASIQIIKITRWPEEIILAGQP